MINNKDLIKLTKEFNLLYVEDHPDTSKTMLYYFNKFFKEVDFVSNGEDALKLYEKKSYDLVITDIQIPKIDGLNMSSKIKKINDKQNIIITSAYNETEMLDNASSIGIDGYIFKPIDYKNLNEVIHETILKIKESKK